MEIVENCKICNAVPSKYCCPRCNILYCSLACYKSGQHGQCSESFYKENVLQEMSLVKDEQHADQSSRQMLEILKRLEQSELTDDDDDEGGSDENDENRFEEIDSDDAEEVPDLGERLSKVNLDDADAIWERLTDEERKEFQGLLASGNIEQILPEVEPWWLGEYSVELIQKAECKALSEGERNLLEKCPNIRKNIKKFAELSTKEPSPLTKYSLVNILAAYVFVFRYFNGDLEESSREAANALIAVAANLKQNSLFDSIPLAVESVCHECRQESLPADKETSLLLRQDVGRILEGPQKCGQKYRKHFLLAALSDVHHLLSRGRKESTVEEKAGVFSSQYSDKSGDLKYLEPVKVRSYLKKVEFMLSYARDYM